MSPATEPRISVVIPAYNTAEYIRETLDSVFAQTFRDFEVIVVNDGSSDTESLERVISKYTDGITYIRQPNSGAGIARNTAIEKARGEIIAFLDGDDIWFPEFLESQFAFLEGNKYDMVYCDADLFGMPHATGKTYMETTPSNGIVDVESLLDLRCGVITSGTMARKSSIVKAGMFENSRVQSEDFHLWLRVSKSGAKIGYQRKRLLKYRVRLDSLSGDLISRIRRGIDVFERVSRTIELTPGQRQIVSRRIGEFETDLAVAKGKVFLLEGKFREAAEVFRQANQVRRSAKLTAILLLTRLAPKVLRKLYLSRREAEIELVPNSEKPV